MIAKIILIVFLVVHPFFNAYSQGGITYKDLLKDEREYVEEWCFNRVKNAIEGERVYNTCRLGGEVFDSLTSLKYKNNMIIGSTILSYGKAKVSGHFFASDSFQVKLISVCSENILSWLLDVHFSELDIQIGLEADSFFVRRNHQLVGGWSAIHDTTENSFKLGNTQYEVRLNYKPSLRSEYYDIKNLYLYVGDLEVFNFSYTLLKDEVNKSVIVESADLMIVEELNLKNRLAKSLMISFIDDFQCINVYNLVRFNYDDNKQVKLVSDILNWDDEIYGIMHKEKYSYSYIGKSVFKEKGEYTIQERNYIDYLFN